MTDPRESAALLVLAQSGHHAASRCADLVEAQGSAMAALACSWGQARRQTSLFEDDDRELTTKLDAARREIARWRSRGMELVSVLDAGYPRNLRAAHDRPPFIFVTGRLKPRDARSIAVIGSRAASPAGLAMASAVAAHLVDSGYTVVSGLAAGIDTAAHTAALARGGRTVAVLGTGLMRCYPAQNVVLQRRIAAQCALVSQFLPEAPPTRRTFPLRNAVMSGMTLASVVIEASATSGARIQARLALAQARPVFLLESLMRRNWARELAALPGTRVVGAPEEIVQAVERLTAMAPLVA